ncbi:MAG: hypothetical protein ACTHJY_02935, partial [Rhizobiaceae bacterium]
PRYVLTSAGFHFESGIIDREPRIRAIAEFDKEIAGLQSAAPKLPERRKRQGGNGANGMENDFHRAMV